MNTTASAAAESVTKSCNAFLSTLAGLGTTWAAYGLKVGKIALEQSAEALGKTAHTLETLAAELEKKAAPKDEIVDADAPKAEGNGVAAAPSA
jgi:hypothetical protein